MGLAERHPPKLWCSYAPGCALAIFFLEAPDSRSVRTVLLVQGGNQGWKLQPHAYKSKASLPLSKARTLERFFQGAQPEFMQTING